MNVAIYSREAIEKLMREDFPNNAAVISFYDPPTKRNAKFYTPPVDYSGKTSRVFQIALNDLDPSALEDVGLTVDTFFTEADDLADFIYAAKADCLDIICQCEYGQSRSAGCAAAILEHFSKTGVSIFTDYRYFPNQLVYHKVFDTLKLHKILSVGPYYYCISEEYIKKQLSQFEGGDRLMLSFTDKKNCIWAKEQIEDFLAAENQLCRSWWGAIDRFIGKNPAQYVSARFSADFWDMDYTDRTTKLINKIKYGFKKIDLVLYHMHLMRDDEPSNPGRLRNRCMCLTCCGGRGFELLAKMMWDDKNSRVILTPMIISEVQR